MTTREFIALLDSGQGYTLDYILLNPDEVGLDITDMQDEYLSDLLMLLTPIIEDLHDHLENVMDIAEEE